MAVISAGLTGPVMSTVDSDKAPHRRSARRKARKRALDILFEADVRREDPATILRARQALAEPPVPEYTVVLINGVAAQRERIDELLSTYSEGWTLERMPTVDRNILRVAIFELLYCDDVPDPVAIDEGVALARELSTDDSPKFVNGLLGRLQIVKE